MIREAFLKQNDMIDSFYNPPLSLLQEFVIQAQLTTNKSLSTLWQELLDRWEPAVPFVISCKNVKEARGLLRTLTSLGFIATPAQHKLVMLSRQEAKSIEANTESLQEISFKDAELWMSQIEKLIKSCN